MNLLLVRHGATDWSDAGRFNGTTDVPLNDKGRDQARALRATLEDRSFEGVWTSDLGRSVETAELAFGDASRDARLRELDFGDLEGRTWEECPGEIQEALLVFDGFVAPGGESVDDLARRVWDFLSGLGDGDHLVFTHGGVIRLLLRVLGRDRRVEPGGFVELADVPKEIRQGS